MARVLMIVFNDYIYDSRVRREAAALISRGDSLDCICLHEKGAPSPDPEVRLFYPSSKKYRGSRFLSHLLASIRFFWFALFKAARLHLAKPYDVVQVATMPDFLVFAALIPKLLGAKVLLDVHDLVPEVYMTKFAAGQENWIVRLAIWIEKRSVAFAHKAMCVHTPHLDALVKHGNPREKFQVMLNVPDDQIFTPQPINRDQQGVFRLIYYGSAPKRAGLDLAVRAVDHLRREIPDIRLTILAGGDGLNPLLDLIRELDLHEFVEFLPLTETRKLPAIIRQATVCVIPYRADVFTQYVLPTKLLECAILGVPVIVSRLPAIEAYFDDSMVAFTQPGDYLDIANQILRLHRHPELRIQLSENAARFAEMHSWSAQRNVYYRVIDSLASSAASMPELEGDAS
jgi:glycosyltransferase involved in cell wall biosynthesis